jgi:hypothetical protein
MNETKSRGNESLVSTHDLLPSERRFVTAMQQLGYGRFESLRIQRGEFVLDPWPTIVRSVKFGHPPPSQMGAGSDEFELKKQIAELFAHVRCIRAGLIRVLEVRGGLPFCMEIANDPDNDGGRSA